LAINVGEADAVQRRLLADGMELPRLVDAFALLEPLERAAGLRVERPPTGAEGEVDLAVAVDVVGIDADVVALGLAFEDGAPFPGGIRIPDDGVRIDDEDVFLPSPSMSTSRTA